MKQIKLVNYLFVQGIIRIFVGMNDEDRIFIERLLNGENSAKAKLLEICKKLSTHVAINYYNCYKDKSGLIDELADVLYLYLMKDEKIFRGFKGSCPLGGFLASVARNFFSSFRLFEDTNLKKKKESLESKQEKIDEMISGWGDDPLLYHFEEPVSIPTEFSDIDKEAAKETSHQRQKDYSTNKGGFNDNVDTEDDKESDFVVDINEVKDSLYEIPAPDKCELVLMALEKMPPREKMVLEKLYFEGYKQKTLAEELHITIGSMYRIHSNSLQIFKNHFMNIMKEYNE